MGATCSSGVCSENLRVFGESEKLQRSIQTQANQHPIATAAVGVLDSVGFVKATSFHSLSIPWPRRQDAGPIYKLPHNDDIIMAISHAWPYQSHPDPEGQKVADLVKMTDKAIETLKPVGTPLCFFDFLSVMQQPFRAGEEMRTPEQQELFKSALEAMPRIYLSADCVLHLELPLKTVPGDCNPGTVPAAALAQVTLHLVKGKVQIVGGVTDGVARHGVGLFDLVVAVDGKPVESVEQARKLCTKCGIAQVQKMSFGFHNKTPASQRGWIYLERFITMCKVALVDESEAPRVVFSNSEAVLSEITEGGARLRKAAAQGAEQIRELMGEFLRELSTKQFSGTSTDAQAFSKDEEIVGSIMQEFAAELPQRWGSEVQKQRRRRFVMAVSRADVQSTRHLLAAGADVKTVFPGQRTALHLAAKSQGLEMAKMLVEAKADLLAVDKTGSCPVHALPMQCKPVIPELFALLAPSAEVLSLKNHAGVTPLAKLRLWARTENFEPGLALYTQLGNKFPELEERLQSPRVLPPLQFVEPEGATTTKCAVGSVDITLHRWEHDKCNSYWLMVCFLPCPTFAVYNHVAQQLLKDNCGLLVWQPWSDLEFEGKSLQECHNEVTEILLTLALPTKLFLVTDVCGTALAWHLEHRIAGLLIINFDSWHTDDYMETGAYAGYCEMMKKFAGMWESGNVAFAASFLAKECVFMEDPAVEVSPLTEQFQMMLTKMPSRFWQAWRWFYAQAAPSGISESMRGRGILQHMPATLVCSSFGHPSIFEDTPRLQRLLPRSEVAYLHKSHRVPYVEMSAAGELAAHLIALLDEANVNQVRRFKYSRTFTD